MIDLIRKNAELVRSMALEEFDGDVGFDRGGVAWLDGYITRQHDSGDPVNVPGLVNTLGSFLGECILQKHAGSWEQDEHGWAVRISERTSERTSGRTAQRDSSRGLKKVSVYPFHKVEKHLVNGPQDSVLAFYDSIGPLQQHPPDE